MKKIFLLGYMGSGKSTIAQKLSQLTGMDQIDLDDYIEKMEQKSINSIFQEKGAIHFRKIERAYLTDLAESSTYQIISLGGGTPCYYNNMEHLNQLGHITIYLQASITSLTSRLYEEMNKRPLLSSISDKNELMEFIGKHLFERRQYYSKAQHQINTDNKTIDDISREIVALLF